jgi:hypothetical protein
MLTELGTGFAVHTSKVFAVHRPIDLLKGVVSTVELVGPQEAREWRDEKHFERQRNISKSNIERLAAEMRAVRLIPGMQIYICVLPDGTEVIINGNHTLEAIALCGIPQVLTVTRKHVADLDEAGRYYAVFDTQKTRSWLDSWKAMGDKPDLPYAQKVIPAVGIIMNKFGQQSLISKVGRTERFDMMCKYYADAVELLAVAMSGAPRETVRLITRAPVMAVALETLRSQPSMAAEFWHRVAQDNGLTAGMPEQSLLRYLRNTKAGGDHSVRAEMVRAAALAWNAAFRGDTRAYFKPNSMASFFLLGTPWHHGFGGQA